MSGTGDFKKIQQKIIDNRIPVSINFELTHRCNFNCIHCVRDIRDTEELGTEKVISILKELREAGTLELAFTGGEIFLRKDIWEILAAAVDLRFSTTVFTNGYILDENSVRKLKSLSLRNIDISIYGIKEETHDKVTGVPGSFRKLMEVFRLMKEHGLPLRLKYMIFDFNAWELPKVYKYARDNGFLITFDEILFVTDSGSFCPLNYLASSDKVKFAERFRIKMSGSDSLWTEFEAEPKKDARIMCTAGRSTAAIAPNGDLLPCIVWRRPLGSLKTTQFKELWEKSKNLQKILDFNDDNFVKCMKCRLKNHCRVCPGMNEAEMKDPFTPSLQKCRLTEIKMEVLDEYSKEVPKTRTDKVQ